MPYIDMNTIADDLVTALAGGFVLKPGEVEAARGRLLTLAYNVRAVADAERS